jgi:hypothetical protein
MTVWNGGRRARLVLGGVAFGAAVAIPIVVGLARNLSDAANVAQIVPLPLAVVSVALGLVGLQSRGLTA